MLTSSTPTSFVQYSALLLHCDSSRALVVTLEKAASVSGQITCVVG